ncbi:MAG TPA: hypothetical protein VLK27_04970 [Chthoniobacterales bacterium]|nr:hypothetical protein [Chthoniobacterales bacterium]
MNTARLSIFAVFASLAFSGPLLAKEKDEDSDSENEVSVEKLVLVRDIGSKFEPVTKFKPTDTYGVLVSLSEGKEGTKVKGIWIAVDAGGMENKKIFEKEVTFDAENLKKATVKNRVDFTLSHDNPYPTGDYKFEAYVNGELADSIEFTIED